MPARSAGRLAEPAPAQVVMTFEAFYERELNSVIGLAYALSGSRAAAEDLAQDAFLAAHPLLGQDRSLRQAGSMGTESRGQYVGFAVPPEGS